MRAFVLLILVGGLVWAVLALFPNNTAVKDDGPETPGSAVDFGGGDETAPASDNEENKPIEAAASTVEEPVLQAPDPIPSNPPITATQAAGLQYGNADLVEIGDLVLHQSSSSVAEWLDASDGLLGGDLEQAVRAFSAALAGERNTARGHWKNIGDPKALSSHVQWLLTRAITGDANKPWPGQVMGGNPLELGMGMALRAFEAKILLAANSQPEAARLISTVLMDALDCPWPADMTSMAAWSALCRKAQLGHRWHPKGEWESIETVVQPGDSLVAIRLRFIAENPGIPISTGLISKVNGLSSDVIHPGQVLRIPTEPVTQLVDLGDHWMLYMLGGEVAASWPIGVGREGEETITGDFTVGNKQYEPSWTRIGKPIVYYGEPENPLGTRYIVWLQDGVPTHYGFHGTWAPESIGKNESDGCVRMQNKAVEELYRIIPVGSSFHVRF
jgi:lipoprotein-anchoring transpeptidase ErfK/SrfK